MPVTVRGDIYEKRSGACRIVKTSLESSRQAQIRYQLQSQQSGPKTSMRNRRTQYFGNNPPENTLHASTNNLSQSANAKTDLNGVTHADKRVLKHQ